MLEALIAVISIVSLVGGGGCIKERGGGYKSPAAGSFEIYTPPPSPPQKRLLANKGGEGGL